MAYFGVGFIEPIVVEGVLKEKRDIRDVCYVQRGMLGVCNL
jgi:hypothetical protein